MTFTIPASIPLAMDIINGHGLVAAMLAFLLVGVVQIIRSVVEGRAHQPQGTGGRASHLVQRPAQANTEAHRLAA